MKPLARAFAVSALVLAAQAAHAEECVFTDDLARFRGAAKVVAQDRVNFALQPATGSACVSKACPYVVQGDVVAVDETSGDMTCATFFGANDRQTSGWVVTALLAPVPAPSAADWAGVWGEKDRRITIRADGDDLVIDGRLRVQQGGPVFSGAFKGRVSSKAKGAILLLVENEKGRQIDPADDDGGCKVKLALVGKTLLAHDENCVGIGSPVAFEGSYQRSKD